MKKYRLEKCVRNVHVLKGRKPKENANSGVCQNKHLQQSDSKEVIRAIQEKANIYYIDGEKHIREEQDLGMIETVTSWSGDQLVISSKGKEVGSAVETLAMVGRQLVISITIKAKNFPNEIVARFYYNRTD